MSLDKQIDMHPKAWITRYAIREAQKRRAEFLIRLKGKGEAIDDAILDPAWERRNANNQGQFDAPVDQAAGLMFERQRLLINEVISGRTLAIAAGSAIATVALTVLSIIVCIQTGIVRQIVTAIWAAF